MKNPRHTIVTDDPDFLALRAEAGNHAGRDGSDLLHVIKPRDYERSGIRDLEHIDRLRQRGL